MRVFLLFIGFAAVGVTALIASGGDLGVPQEEEIPPAQPLRTNDTATEVNVIPLERIRMHSGEGIQVTAAPESFDWTDPEDPRTVVFVPNWFAWDMSAESIAPLPQEADGQIRALCRDVVIRRYRKPENVVEALALKNGAPGAHEALLLLQFTAAEARITTPLETSRLAGENDKAEGRKIAQEIAENSVVRLSGGVDVIEKREKVRIVAAPGRGEVVVRMRPGQEAVRGTGAFTLDHEAFHVRGEDLLLRRIDQQRTNVEIPRAAVVKLKPEISAVGGSSFEPTTVSCEGRFLLRSTRPKDEPETVHAEFHDRVRVEQLGGRSLEADILRIEIEGTPREGEQRRNSNERVRMDYELRRATAEGHVHVAEDANAATPPLDRITEMNCGLLVYERRADGETIATLEQNPEIVVRGLLPTGTDSNPERGFIRASCVDQIRLGPAPVALPVPEDFDRRLLRRLTFKGSARLERYTEGEAPTEEIVEADQIQFILAAFAGPFAGEAAKEAVRPEGAPAIVPIAIFAYRSVRIRGENFGAQTETFRAMDLHEAPHLSLLGKGTRVWVRGLGGQSGMLGAGAPPQPAAPAPGNAPSEPPTASPNAEDNWTLRHAEADGNVRVETTLTSASVQLPTMLEGARLSYDEISGMALLKGTAGAPALVQAGDPGSDQHQELRALGFSVDLSAGRITAKGGVKGILKLIQDQGAGGGLTSNLSVDRGNSGDGLMEIRTDAGIEIRLTLDTDAEQVDLAYEQDQIIRVRGPLQVEMTNGDDQPADRLEADSLEIVLVKQRPGAPGTEAAESISPAGLFRPANPNQPPASQPFGSQPAGEVETIHLDTQMLVLNLTDGEASSLEATGGVSLDADMGRMRGSRLYWDAAHDRMRIDGSEETLAEVWLGEGAEQSHVQARRFEVDMLEGKPSRIRAIADPDRGVFALLSIAEEVKPGEAPQYQVIRVHAAGDVIVGNTGMQTGKVDVVRFLRDAAGQPIGDPMQLRAERLEVFGASLLDSAQAELQRLVATGRRVWVNVQRGDDRIQVWGTRLEFDERTQRAEIRGDGPRGVQLLSTTGEEQKLNSTHETVVLTLEGGDIKNLFTTGSDVYVNLGD